MSEQSIFLTAIELDAAERAEYLSKACANNDRLRTEVEKLIAAHESSKTFLNKPAIEQIASKVPSNNQNALTVSADGVGTDDDTRTATQGQRAHVDDSLSFLKPATRNDSIGRIDHYEVLEKVGAGGFGTVLKVFDDRLHRVVAMKVLAPQLAASGTARARFIREARSAAAVKSEHIVGIHAIDEGSHPYLVMEFVAGQTLQQKIDSTGPLGVKEILRIGHQIAAGLAAAHATGLVHRDIKPANVLLENGVERVKITDFGLARAADDASISQSGVVAGTPTYMAPEQARGEHVDHRADLFSLGSVMYAMCTGRPPFRASTTMATLKRVCDDTARPIREINPEIPEWLAAIVAKLHAKNSADRFQTAKEVAKLLQQHLAHLQQPSVAALPPAVVMPSESLVMPAAVERPAATTSPRRQFRLAAILLVVVGLPLVLVPILLFADKWMNHIGVWIGLGVVIAGLTAYLLSVVVQMPGSPATPSPRRSPRRLRIVLAAYGAALVLAAMLYVSFQPTIHLLIGDKGELALNDLNPEFETIRVTSDDGAHVYNVEPRTALKLPPGKYRVEAIGRNGEVVTRWRFEGGAFFAGAAGTRDEETLVVDLHRGQRIRLSIAKWAEGEKGWVALFNRMNLDGWEKLAEEPGNWQVIDGILVGSGGPGHLYTVRDNFRNFQLRAEVAISKGADSGIYFRSVKYPPAAPNAARSPSGYVVDLREGDNVSTGPISFLNPQNGVWTTQGALSFVKPDEWFKFEISAIGNHLVSKINGVTVVEFDDATDAFQKGHIALQVWKPDTVVNFRKIEIRELPSNDVDPESTIPFPDPVTLAPYANQIGKMYRFDVIGATEGPVWGTGVYSADSMLAAAAVHGGFLKPGQRGIVQVSILPAQTAYKGSTANGVTSADWTYHPASFRITRLVNVADVNAPSSETAPTHAGSLAAYVNQIGKTLVFEVVGASNGSCWGTDIYTADSDLGTAAVHAGVLKVNERGRVRVNILAGQNSYAGAARNGVTSLSYASFPASYRVEAAGASSEFDISFGNKLKKLAVAMHSYYSVNEKFPTPANYDDKGTPLLSWRVHLLPHMGHEELYKQFRLNEPWDSAHNRKLIERIPPEFEVGAADFKTSIVVPVGADTIFPGAKAVKLQEIVKGAGNTLLILECDKTHQVVWTKPDDWPVNPFQPSQGLAESFWAARADGGVFHLSGKMPTRVLRSILSRTDNEPIPPETWAIPGVSSFPLPDPGALTAYQNRIDKTFSFTVVGSANGSVWGTDVYSLDSRLSTAAVHAGFLKVGQRGTLRVKILPGQENYTGSTKNGVTSSSYVSYPASFRILDATDKSDPSALVFTGSVSTYRGQIGKSFEAEVVGNSLPSCWGTDIYSDDSDLGTAAVHAGILKIGEKGRVKVTILAGQSNYVSTTRNGITTSHYATFPGSFRVEAATPRTDEELLQGTWTAYEAESAGEKTPPEGISATFAGDRVRISTTPGRKPGELPFKVDSKKNPKEIDIGAKKDAMRGIYKFDGDTLTVAIADPGTTRPQKFETGATTGSLVVLKFRKSAPEPITVPRRAADVLPFFAGTWKTERIQIEPKLPAEEARELGESTYEFVADGKFLRARGTNGEREVILVYSFDAVTDKLNCWFAVAGRSPSGPAAGVYDAAKHALQWLERLPNGNVIFHEYTLVDSNTITTRLYQQDPKNKIVTEVQMKFKRIQGPIALPNLPVDPKRPEEMKVLDRLVGEWQHELTVTEAGKQKAEKSKSVAKSILQGRMVEVFETNETRKTNDYWLAWFDDLAKQYRTWYFASDGTASDFTGTWNEAQKTMSWKSADDTVDGKWIFKSDDLREMPMTVKDKSGKVLKESKGESRRVSVGTAPKAANPVDLQALRFVVAAKERILKTETVRYEAGQISLIEMLRTEADWIEARLNLAAAEDDRKKLKALAKALVFNWREERDLLADRVRAGLDQTKVLDVHDARVAETQARIAKGKIDLPATVAVEFVILASDEKAERTFAKASEVIAVATEKDKVEVRWLTLNPLNEQVKILRAELVETRRNHGGVREAIVVAKLMSQVAWPLDTWHRARVTPEQCAAIGFKDAVKTPLEVVGVIETPATEFDMSFMALSPDAQTAALSAGSKVLLVDVASGNILHKFSSPGRYFTAAAFSPDGKTVAIAGLDGHIKTWDVASGAEGYTLPGLFFSLSFSDDGKTLTATGGDYKTFRNETIFTVFDLDNRKVLREFKPKTPHVPDTVAFSPDRKLVAATIPGGSSVKWWNVADVKELQVKKTERAYAGRAPVALSSDGKLVAAGAEKPLLKIWDAATGREERSLTADSMIFDLSYSPDGSILAAQVGFEKISLWDAQTYAKRATIPVSSVRTVFTPDSRHLLLHQGARVVILRLRDLNAVLRGPHG